MIEEVTGLIDDFLLILVLIRNDDFKASSPIFLSILSCPVHKCQFFVPQSQTAKQRMHVGYIAQINTHIRNSQRFQKFQRHDNDFAVTFRRRIAQHFHPVLCEVLPMRGFSEKFAETVDTYPNFSS